MESEEIDRMNQMRRRSKQMIGKKRTREILHDSLVDAKRKKKLTDNFNKRKLSRNQIKPVEPSLSVKTHKTISIGGIKQKIPVPHKEIAALGNFL